LVFVKPLQLSGNTLEKLITATKDAFGIDMDKEDIENHIQEADILSIFYCNQEPVGFASYRDLEDILYLHGVAVARKCQKQGFLNRSLRSILSQNNKYNYLAYRTQNPVMYYVGKKLAEQSRGEIYPTLSSSEIPEYISRVAHKVCSEILKSQCPDDLIFRGIYGSALYQELPRSPDARVNEYFHRVLDLDNGDAMLVIIKLR